MPEKRKQGASDASRLTADEIRDLRNYALGGRVRGWRPYSKFAVAAAVLTKDGRTYGGAGNVECANYTLTKHAEETALIAALADGAFERIGRRFLRAVYLATARAPGKPWEKCTPCGGCRQFLWEFSDKYTWVVMELPSGRRDTRRLADMLPAPFGPANLKIKDTDSPRE